MFMKGNMNPFFKTDEGICNVLDSFFLVSDRTDQGGRIMDHIFIFYKGYWAIRTPFKDFIIINKKRLVEGVVGTLKEVIERIDEWTR